MISKNKLEFAFIYTCISIVRLIPYFYENEMTIGLKNFFFHLNFLKNLLNLQLKIISHVFFGTVVIILWTLYLKHGTFWLRIEFQLGEEFTECMKKTNSSKGNKVMEGVLGTTYFELYLALQEFCKYGQQLPEWWVFDLNW